MKGFTIRSEGLELVSVLG